MSKDSEDKKKKKKSTGSEVQEFRLVPADYMPDPEEDEIDLLELAGKLWKERFKILKFAGYAAILGLFVAFLSPKEYETTATLLPEYSLESQGGAAQLLQRFGGLLGSGGSGSYAGNSNAIRVQLYPEIVQSIPFQLELLDEKIYSPEYDTTVTVYEYFTEIRSPGLLSLLIKYTIRLPFTILSAVMPKEEIVSSDLDGNILKISKEKMEVIKVMKERIQANLDEKTGIVSLRAEMPEPMVAAVVAEKAFSRLQEYLVEYRVEKVSTDLKFIQEQYDQAKARFEKLQEEKAKIDDSNLALRTQQARIESDRINAEYSLASSIYSSLAQQLEQAKIKLQEETPLFKVLQPVQLPIEKSKPRRSLILFIFVFLGGITGVGYVLVMPFIESIKSNFR